jgi:hypothetical protein
VNIKTRLVEIKDFIEKLLLALDEAPKKRGRPAKVVAQVATQDKPKRGRPRKVAVDGSSPRGRPKKDKAIVIRSTPAGKPRGRPKKAQVPPAVPQETTGTVPVEVAPVPPKDVAVDTKAENDTQK